MVCTADELLEWKDFPKGLRVLLLDQDSHSAAEIKLKLEQMDYLVSTFYNEDEALNAISNKCESFHVAIIEVSIGDSLGSFKFLETVKDLPTIMISNIHCLSTMMKCIALGAAEFLQKPLSEEKLRNIWQHVVHKAFNAGEGTISESLKPVKETVASMLDLKLENIEHEQDNISGNEIEFKAYECDHEQSIVSDRFPGPSTPQLKQGGRLLDDGDCKDQQIPPTEKHCQEQDGESKFVETTCNNSVAQATTKLDPLIKQEGSPSLGGSESTTTASNLSSQVQQDKDGAKDSNAEPSSRKKGSLHPNPSANRVNRKKMKVDWTPDLHKRFVQAVEQLGVDQAIPSRILELMKAEGLTRHNVASHLQKYRLNKRHILPKEDIQNRKPWQYPRTTHHQSIMPRTYNYHHHQQQHHHKPIMAYPPPPPPPPYHVWGHPSSHHHPSAVQMWGHQPGFPTWQPPESQPWPTYPAMNVDAWGCPVMPPPSQVPSATMYPQVHNPAGYQSLSSCQDGSSIGNNSFDLHMDEEEVIIDRVMKEAISKPWLPLPLGLKPPSTESVLIELQRQGISNIPPSQHNNHH